ncbi:TPA: hypothetical protein ACNUZJ_003921 [Raoultella ornithinolytica]
MADVKEVAEGIREVFFQPVKEALIYRAKSIFYGSFLTSWFVFNWDRLAYFLLSSDDVLKKIYLLKSERPEVNGWEHLFGTWWDWFVYPLILSLFIVWFYPYLIFYSAKIHEKILGKINISRNLDEVGKIQSRVDLITARENEAGLKEKARAKLQMEISLDREATIRSNRSVDELLDFIEKNELRKSELEMEIKSKSAIISEQNERLENTIKRISTLKEEGHPLEESDRRIENLKKDNDILRVEAGKAIAEKETIAERLSNHLEQDALGSSDRQQASELYKKMKRAIELSKVQVEVIDKALSNHKFEENKIIESAEIARATENLKEYLNGFNFYY